MFDELLRQIKKLERMNIPIQLPLDDDSYLDRKCPSENCKSDFKVQFEDWRNKVRDEVVYCPICRGEARGTEWNTEEQAEYIKSVSMRHLHKEFNKAMQIGAEAANRRQPKNSFLKISFSVKPGAQPAIIPVDAAGIMQQKFVCEACGCRYASIGAAFFCPACGHNSATTVFDQALEAVRRSIEMLPSLKENITANFNVDAAQDTARQIIETGLGKLVSSFQRFAEQKFSILQNASNFKPRKNLFLNLNESTKLWRTATGRGYEDILSPPEMSELTKLFQQRHLLAHRDGIVDQEYISKSGDTSYSVGQRLVVREASVIRLADLLSKLASGL